MAPMPPGDFSLGASAGGVYGRTLPEVPVLSWPVQPTLVPVPIVCACLALPAAQLAWQASRQAGEGGVGEARVC